mmetsp:Transcript_50002/g.113514  ORF Transcript_50002/g.113514 Transcript_50002/m.113514 type:complete len:243 (-) Transcript_50002:175-903(-)
MWRRLLVPRRLGAPGQPSRRFIAMPQGEEAVVVGSLIASNVAVYGAWQYAESKDRQTYRFMVDNFMVSRDSALSRPHTVVTAAFSHSSGYHLLGNMMTLFFFGPTCISALGARTFLSMYFTGAVVSNVSFVATAKSSRDQALGASGAVNAAVAYSIAAEPFRMIIVLAEFLPIPLPAVLYGTIFIGKDVAAMFGTELNLPFGLGRKFTSGDVAHAAHVGGAAVGLAYFFLSRGRRQPWRRLR